MVKICELIDEEKLKLLGFKAVEKTKKKPRTLHEEEVGKLSRIAKRSGRKLKVEAVHDKTPGEVKCFSVLEIDIINAIIEIKKYKKEKNVMGKNRGRDLVKIAFFDIVFSKLGVLVEAGIADGSELMGENDKLRFFRKHLKEYIIHKFPEESNLLTEPAFFSCIKYIIKKFSMPYFPLVSEDKRTHAITLNQDIVKVLVEKKLSSYPELEVLCVELKNKAKKEVKQKELEVLKKGEPKETDDQETLGLKAALGNEEDGRIDSPEVKEGSELTPKKIVDTTITYHPDGSIASIRTITKIF